MQTSIYTSKFHLAKAGLKIIGITDIETLKEATHTQIKKIKSSEST